MPNKKPEESISLKITLPPKLILLMLSIWIVSVIVFILFPANQRDCVIFGASSLGGIAALIGAFYLARGLMLSAQQQRNALDQKAKENALRYLERWNDPQFCEFKVDAEQVIKIQEKENSKAVAVKIHEDDTFKRRVSDILNFFEEIAIAVDSKTVDEDILRRAYKGLLNLYCMALQDFIKDSRRRFGNPRLYIEIENLHKRWS